MRSFIALIVVALALISTEANSGVTIVSSSEAEDEYCYKALAVNAANQKSDFSNVDCVFVEESPPWGLVELLPDERLEIELSREEAPKSYALEANYPNPFNPQTAISFALPVAADVSLDVYDVMVGGSVHS